MNRNVFTSLKDFELVSKLGDGAFAEVFKVRRKEDGKYYAMKKIRMAKIREKDRNNALNQIRILASDSGQNIIEFKEAFYDQSSSTLCIIMEHAAKGDLMKLIQTHIKKNTKIPESQIWKALVHISNGLQSLHSKKILHRDLKGANVFITSEGVYKLGDMNVSKVIKHDLAKTQTGTPYYASPEVWKDKPYGNKSDMWSLGCVLYEMAAQRPPFTATDIQTLYKKICTGTVHRIPFEYSNELAGIIASLLKLDPNDRPSATDLLNNSTVEQNFSYRTSRDYSHEKNELLQTIRVESRNLKMINSMLPQSNYERKNLQDKIQERTIIDSFFKENNKNKANSSSTKERSRVKSCFQGEDTLDFVIQESKNTKRSRIASEFEPFQIKNQSSIEKISIFKDIAMNQKPRIRPNINNYLKSSKLPIDRGSIKSKLQSQESTQTCRKKAISVVQKIISSESVRQKNKQNLQKMGQHIVNRIFTKEGYNGYI